MARQPSAGQRGGPRPKRRGAKTGAQSDAVSASAAILKTIDRLTVAAKNHDAVALVQLFVEWQTHGLTTPAWALEALEHWLADFMALARPGKGSVRVRRGTWTETARRWRRTFLDAAIADHLREAREHGDLTWAEAYDEAVEWFRGTAAAGGKDAMREAYKRDRQRGGLGRPVTRWEHAVADDAQLTARPFKADGWIVQNAHHRDPSGKWKRRPDLLNTLGEK